MYSRSSSWVLVFALWLSSPEQCVWAGGNGVPPLSTQIQAASPAGQRDHQQFPGGGWSAQVKASNKEPGSSLRGVFSRRTVLGLALAGSGVYFIGKGFDFHRKADALYRRYLDALDPAEISLLYQRSTQQDLKSRLSWALGAVLAASGVHILFGRQLAVFHLELAPSFAGTPPLSWGHGAQVTLSRDF